LIIIITGKKYKKLLPLTPAKPHAPEGACALATRYGAFLSAHILVPAILNLTSKRKMRQQERCNVHEGLISDCGFGRLFLTLANSLDYQFS